VPVDGGRGQVFELLVAARVGDVGVHDHIARHGGLLSKRVRTGVGSERWLGQGPPAAQR
jgi:hypothetical protein